MKKRTHRLKRFACKLCGEKFKYRYQLTRHDNHNHRQGGAGDAAQSHTVPATDEGEIEYLCLFYLSITEWH